jgi:hypothetical protein
LILSQTKKKRKKRERARENGDFVFRVHLGRVFGEETSGVSACCFGYGEGKVLEGERGGKFEMADFLPVL